MRAVFRAAAVVLASATAASQPPLHVLRAAPGDPAEPTSVISVTFDRPVAGQLDGTVDPATIFSIVPAVPGKVEWRDPITLVFTPDAPLATRTRYTVTIANTFRSMDGATLEQPFELRFRVGGPRVLDGSPVGPGRAPQYLRGDVRFDLVTSMPVDLAEVAKFAHVELSGCQGPALVGLTAVSQRAIRDDDPGSFKEAGGWRRDRRFDRYRRVVTLAPQQPLPQACAGRLAVLPLLDEASTEPPANWTFRTYGPLRLTGATCDNAPLCPAGYARVNFSTPVRGADVLRVVHLAPAVMFTVDDTADAYASWALQAPLRTRTQYTITVDSTLTDVFGQRLTGPRTTTLATTGYQPGLDYETGMLLVERASFRTIAVRHVNVDTLLVTTAPVPESLEARILAAPRWNVGDAWPAVAAGATTRAVPAPGAADVPLVSAVKLPAYNAMRPGAPTLTLVRVERRGAADADPRRYRRGAATAVVQVTDLGLAARLGADEALVWVTTLHDGRAAAGAAVTLYGPTGQVRATATTDSSGVARFSGLTPLAQPPGGESRGFQGYVAATLGSDRAVVSFDDYSWELSPWRFNVSRSGAGERLPAAAAVFTERGIYRPGEDVHAKAIVRTGSLGALRAPAPGDSLHWVFRDRENGTLADTVVALSAFGTADKSFRLGNDLPLGTYRIELQLKRGGSWTSVASTWYRVAEYRPPEFLVSLSSDTAPHQAGDTLRPMIEARYLFGAPMGRAAVSWTARRSPAWWFDIPGLEDWQFGESGWWWEDDEESSGSQAAEVVGGATDTLDATGHLALRVPLTQPAKGRAARVTVQATVTDVNRQTVTATTSAIVHPAAIYVAVKPLGESYFWRAGRAESLAVLTVRPDGRRVAGVAVHGVLVRREWHSVMRERGGYDEQVGDWVSDTVAQCDVTSATDPAPCRFTPPQGGSYVLTFRARDAAGRVAVTSFYRWATGRGWVPWGDENQFKMDVIPDKTRYSVGDTATVLFASPFTNAEALVTVEREGVIEYRRMRITSGATSMKLALTESHVPNVFVSIVVVRGRSAPAGGIADAGRPALRVGYTELRVMPAVKRLDVQVRPQAPEYRPGDSARVELRVRDSRGAGQRSEVTLWAVDEGVLSLTGYKTPDPVDLLYQPRGVGLTLASNLVDIAAQVLDSEGVSIKGDRAPGGGGGLETGDILRSRFQTTAFFIGSVVTDSSGRALVAAKLPDNLTTFRVMAVAVTQGDRYGSGQSPLLVTRPLIARPALPRFLRRDDRVVAGIVVNQRAGGTPQVRVRAAMRGVTLSDAAAKTATLTAGRGTEVRFSFRDTASDQATLRFDVSSGADSDAVLTRLPVRPDQTPRAHTAAGVVSLTSAVELDLPGDIDPDRSQLVFSIGTTPLALIRGMYGNLAVYPYDCSEQISDEMMPLVALLRYGAAAGLRVPAGARHEVEQGVATLVRRQRADGGIGLWDAQSWTTPWLSAYAGQALLGARALGIPVSDSVMARLAGYLSRAVHQRPKIEAPLGWWFTSQRAQWSESVAALDFLSSAGRPDLAGENELLRLAPQLWWSDRVRLAEIIARRGATAAAASLLRPIWAATKIEGRRAILGDSIEGRFYFWSAVRPAARLLSATLAVDSANPLIGPLVETIIEQARSSLYWWNTADYGAAVEALADFTARQQRAARRGFTVAGGGRILFSSDGGDPLRQFTRNLAGLLAAPAPDGSRKLTLTVTAPASSGAAPLYYYVTVLETARTRAVNPDDQGIAVERWYEDYTTGRPTVSVPEGSLVRVRLRIRVTGERRFLVLSDPLPAGLEAVDLSLATSGLPGPGIARPVPSAGGGDEDEGEAEEQEPGGQNNYGWYYGMWDCGWWSPFDHRDMRDDRVDYVATYLWPGTYTATYVARATTPGVFVRPPAHAEEMYNPSVQGRSDGGVFTITRRSP